jgi:STE24 endopeptidase
LTGGPFTPEQIERAARYHRPLYVALAIDGLLSLVLLALLAFGSIGDGLFDLVDGLAWWAATPAFTSMVIGSRFVVGLPLSYWRGYVREKAWGFSTQTAGGWLADRAKGLAVGLVISGGVFTGFIGLARALPDSWPFVAAPLAAGLVLVLSFVAPVLLEPVFNKFRPLEDEELAADLRELSVQAGVPVREVLVADASRRTRKENAYVSGLGQTRRVVLYDTLLARGEPRQVRLVTAHELGHRRLRHVAAFTVLGMIGAVGAVLGLSGVLSLDTVLGAVGAGSAGDPRVVPFVMLVGGGLQFLTLPFLSALSRRWESAADRFSLEMTADARLFEDSHRDLAISNLSDLRPPRLIYLALFSHPTPPERIALAREWERAAASLT